MTRPLARRDFVLDSGGLSHLAESPHRAKLWTTHIGAAYDGAAVLVPTIVMTELATGDARDARLHQFLRMIDDPDRPGRFWLDANPPLAMRAGMLRTRALKQSSASSKPSSISVVDAQVVALAEQRSLRHAVTIITSDVPDIQLLVNLTGKPNIAVEGV